MQRGQSQGVFSGAVSGQGTVDAYCNTGNSVWTSGNNSYFTVSVTEQ